MNKTGLTHIYTGDGKGKSTAAIGLAARAAGAGLRVVYASFHKNPELYGYHEMVSMKRLGITVFNYAKDHPHLDPEMDIEPIKNDVEAAIDQIAMMITTIPVDMLIIDEILISIRDQFISENRLIDFIDNKPKHMELILTGRMATERLMEKADYVSFIKKIKHPYDQGTTSRKGIEY